MYALIEYKGKQYKAEEGAVIRVDKIAAETGEKITIDSVLLVSNGSEVTVGTPYVTGSSVVAVVGDHIKDKKVLVYKYKRKKDYHRTIGHRQRYTFLTIESIAANQ